MVWNYIWIIPHICQNKNCVIICRMIVYCSTKGKKNNNSHVYCYTVSVYVICQLCVFHFY